jgi:IclR family acetate operon transcriptional repressor
MALLELVATQDDGIGVREAARRTGIDRSAVSRMLSQLEDLGYVQQEHERGVFGVGPRLFSLASALTRRDSLVAAAEPVLTDLVSRFAETCYLVTRVDDSFEYRFRAECSRPIRSAIDIGTTVPLGNGVPGWAILTALSQDERDNIVQQSLSGTAPADALDGEALGAQLAKGTRLGYSFHAQAWGANGGEIAAPFVDAHGRCVGAISLSGPTDRLHKFSIGDLGAAVCQGAIQLSDRLGFRADVTGL